MNSFLWLTTILLFFISNSAIDLGSNLIQNSRFRYPDLISPNISHKFYTSPSFVPGWKCTNNCELANCRYSTPNLYQNCRQQVLDISSNQIQTVTQIFEAGEGEHQINVEFILPLNKANKKIILIYFNGVNIYSFQPLVTKDYHSYRFVQRVFPIVGSNSLTFTMAGLNDQFGFRLISVEVRRILNIQIEQTIQSIFTNSLSTNIIEFPGSRVLLGHIINTFVYFDRMQLYYNHNRNFSYYTIIFLKGVSNLMNSKGEMSLKIQKKLIANVGKQQQDFIAGLDYKQSYINTNILSKSQNGYGFLSNNSNLFIYSLPYFILFILLLHFFFRLAFNYKFSKLLRRYSFVGIIIIQMICQGNIEQYAFYTFGQFNTFFSANYRHKIVNAFISFFFFFVVFCSSGIYFWCWKCYKTNIKYFTDNVQSKFTGILAYSISNGIICMVFGAVHQLLLSSPNLQLLTLFLVEIVWVMLQTVFLSMQAYKLKMFIFLNIIEGFMRMYFQISLYLFTKTTNKPLDASFLNSQIHLRQIFLFISLWALQLLASLIFFMKESFGFFKKTTEKNDHQKIVKIQMKKVRFFDSKEQEFCIKINRIQTFEKECNKTKIFRIYKKQ